MSNRTLAAALAFALALGSLASAPTAAHASEGSDYLRDARTLYHNGQYFKAARYAFAAGKADPQLGAEAYAWSTMGLARAGLHNSASYFFVRTLQSGNKAAIRRVLTLTEELFVKVGGDFFRPYLVQFTTYEDYDALNRGAYLYSLGKEALLRGDEQKAVGYISGVTPGSPLWPLALHLRGSAFAILGQNEKALADFRACARDAMDSEAALNSAQDREDLMARCQAGEARTFYQMDRFAEAERAYDRVPKASFVWPEILFEQAWTGFAKGEYNRTLGKLVSYKSPALDFVFNTESDVLRAQAYLGLCLYSDANDVINEFNSKYTGLGEQVKKFVESNSGNLEAFHVFGKEALRAPLHTKTPMYRIANRFIRGPYFRTLIASERAIQSELRAVQRFGSSQPGVSRESGQGFPGFLGQVLQWRTKAIRDLGGAFVKNSLMDHHSILISDFEKMAFIKLEMLGRAKQQLLAKQYPSTSRDGDSRVRGNVEPKRRDDQFRWSFNGEFWNDELGDYVFGLESECRS